MAALRCGVQRQSMRTNVFIHRPGLAEVSKMTFANPGAERVFGVPKRSDPEGARDVTTFWKCHQANPDDQAGAPTAPARRPAPCHAQATRNRSCRSCGVEGVGCQGLKHPVVSCGP